MKDGKKKSLLKLDIYQLHLIWRQSNSHCFRGILEKFEMKGFFLTFCFPELSPLIKCHGV